MGIREDKLARLEKLRPLFNYLPFVDFALIAGSLAFGSPKETSDFDLILGCRKKRIWTARFSAMLIFSLAGVRRNSQDPKESSADKVCLNHFVTPDAYRLREPHNKYWQELYKKLIPFAGNTEKINEFFYANADWVGEKKQVENVQEMKSGVKNLKEFFLGGLLGDLVERGLKFIQLKKIHRHILDESKKPRVFISDEELEFHPDTLRIEEYLRNYP
jgi:hypothetical protein